MPETPEHALAASHSFEAINAAKNAAEAIEKARTSQFESALVTLREETKESFVHAMNQVLNNDDGSGVILIKRIPFICTDILWIKRAIFGIFALMGTLLVALLAK